jgi:hypothetical protein
MNSHSLLRFEKPGKYSLVIAIIALLMVAATWFWLFKTKWPLGVKGEWRMNPNAGAWPVGAWGLPVAALGIFGGFAALCAYDRLRRAKNRREQIASTRLCLIGICLLSFVWPWTLLGPGGTSNLIASQWSDTANEYFSTAYLMDDARRFTSEYAATRQHPASVLQAHVATHPPGAVLFYYGARRVYESTSILQSMFSGLAVSLTTDSVEKIAADCNRLRGTATRSAGVRTNAPDLPSQAVGGALWSAFLISLLLALATPAIYLAASSQRADSSDETQIVNSEMRGLLAAAFWALYPAANLFAFTLDAVIAAGAAWTLALLALRLRGGKPQFACACGGVLALTSFISFGALATGAIVFLALVFFHGGCARIIARELAFIGAGFVATWFVLTLIFPMQPLVIFSQAIDVHRYATGGRSRVLWAWLNILIFAVFCGWPLFVAAMGALSHWKQTGGMMRAPLVLGVSGVLTILLLTLSGQASGEVERLWIFLAVPLCILAATALLRHANALVIGTLLVLQALQTLLMAAWLAPLVLPF